MYVCAGLDDIHVHDITSHRTAEQSNNNKHRSNKYHANDTICSISTLIRILHILLPILSAMCRLLASVDANSWCARGLVVVDGGREGG